jgi:hypothetical protein
MPNGQVKAIRYPNLAGAQRMPLGGNSSSFNWESLKELATARTVGNADAEAHSSPQATRAPTEVEERMGRGKGT